MLDTITDLPILPPLDATFASTSEFARAAVVHALEATERRSRVTVDNVQAGAHGADKQPYMVQATLSPDPRGRSGDYVVLVPRPTPSETLIGRLWQEALVLQALGEVQLPFSTPRLVGVLVRDDHPVLIEEWVGGIPLSKALVTRGFDSALSLVAEAAAAIHTVDVQGLRGVADGVATRREHLLADLDAIANGTPSPVREARDWIRDHLPPPSPSCLVHGDLEGHNILQPWDSTSPPAIIDWGFARLGDPAYDLALVTRCRRRPFGLEGGRRAFVEAYRRAGGLEVSEADVVAHELVMAMTWHQWACSGRQTTTTAEEELTRLQRLMARAETSLARS